MFFAIGTHVNIKFGNYHNNYSQSHFLHHQKIYILGQLQKLVFFKGLNLSSH